jgi:hypothetical protein
MMSHNRRDAIKGVFNGKVEPMPDGAFCIK